jgi:hypothetical protein
MPWFKHRESQVVNFTLSLNSNVSNFVKGYVGNGSLAPRDVYLEVKVSRCAALMEPLGI